MNIPFHVFTYAHVCAEELFCCCKEFKSKSMHRRNFIHKRQFIEEKNKEKKHGNIVVILFKCYKSVSQSKVNESCQKA